MSQDPSTVKNCSAVSQSFASFDATGAVRDSMAKVSKESVSSVSAGDSKSVIGTTTAGGVRRPYASGSPVSVGGGNVMLSAPIQAENFSRERTSQVNARNASARAAASDRLKTKALQEAQARFLNKDAGVAFVKSGESYQFNREALEQLLTQLGSNAKTVDIGGHDIPLGVFDNGVTSFAELDKVRVENGAPPLFSKAN
jgi:hypothetical protein